MIEIQFEKGKKKKKKKKKSGNNMGWETVIGAVGQWATADQWEELTDNYRDI